MNKKYFFLLFILYIFFGFQLSAQTVKVDGEIRSRAEYRDGFREPLADTLNPSYVNNLRTKLNLQYESDDIRAKISLIDSRVYGGTDISKTGDGLGVLEAWGEYHINSKLSFALGRQGLEYDDKRLFSYNNWSNTPGAHDMLLLKYEADGFSIHLGTAYNNAGDSSQFLAPYKLAYKTLNYIWLNKKIEHVSFSALWVNDSFERGNVGAIHKSYRNTIGGNIWSTNQLNTFTFRASGYYQFGHDKSDKSLNSYLLSINIQQKISRKWFLIEGADVISGSEYNINENKNKTFTKLYGTNHAFNGSIEYWSTLPNQGLIDLYLGTVVKFSSRFDANLTFHKFSTTLNTEENKKNLGSEIDITANYNLSKHCSIQGGWSTYFATSLTDIIKKKESVNTRFPQWAYIQISFKPTFL